MTIINEGKKYRELKESITMINTQRSDSEKVNLTEEGKKKKKKKALLKLLNAIKLLITV